MGGLTSAGLVIETEDEIRSSMAVSLAGKFGVPVSAVGDDTLDGHLIAIVAERIGKCWLGLEMVHKAFDPDAATGQSQIALGALSGTQPLAPIPSSVTLTLTGTPGTTVDAGSQASVTGTEDRFATLTDSVIATVTAWAPSTNYALNDRRTNNDRIYLCTVAGVSDTLGGPTTTSPVIVDGTAQWRFLGEGTGQVEVASASLENGKIFADSGQITTIETPTGGWQSVMNVLDADLGRSTENSEAFRLRREGELHGQGTSPREAIEARLARVAGVTAVHVFHNVGDDTDEFGVEAHSIEALVLGGDDQIIRDTIRANIAGGIRTSGSVIGTSTDSQGNVHEIRFSRPQSVPVYIAIDLVKDRRVYGGDIAVSAQIVAFGDTQPSGRDAEPSAISAQAFKIAGVFRVTAVRVGLAPNPTGTVPIEMSLRQLALYDTSRIEVTSIDGTP